MMELLDVLEVGIKELKGLPYDMTDFTKSRYNKRLFFFTPRGKGKRDCVAIITLINDRDQSAKGNLVWSIERFIVVDPEYDFGLANYVTFARHLMCTKKISIAIEAMSLHIGDEEIQLLEWTRTLRGIKNNQFAYIVHKINHHTFRFKLFSYIIYCLARPQTVYIYGTESEYYVDDMIYPARCQSMPIDATVESPIDPHIYFRLPQPNTVELGKTYFGTIQWDI
jgi:hypothetical protein